jgi:DNA polymerase (family 10)
MVSLLRIPGIGPKTAVRLVSELGVSSPDELAQAARDGRIQALYGFGPKREARLGAQAEGVLRAAA